MITILDNAPLVAPVYNPINIRVSSDQITQEGFSFIFDLYVNGIYVNRTRLQPRPGTNECIYSPARILESYVSYDLTQNTIGTELSVNCIDQYEIRVGEEYVYYWYFSDNTFDLFTSTTYTILTHPTNIHTFNKNDNVLVIQSPGYTYEGYNGVHKVDSVPDNKNILINVNHVNTPLNGGKVAYADKRKTIHYLAQEQINNNELNYTSGQWSTYGPDGCGVRAGLEITNVLQTVVPDTSCATGIQLITNSAVLVPGTTYRVVFTVSAINNPSGAQIYIGAYFGGVLSPTIDQVGTYTFDVTMGSTDTNFGIYMDLDSADTSGFGAHSASISYVSVLDIDDLIEAYDFNGVVSYEEYPTWDYSQYVLSGIQVGKFLTKSPRILKTTLEERGSLGLMNIHDPQSLVPGISFYLHIDVKDKYGIITNYVYPVTELDASPFTNEKYIHLGSYPWNINQFSTANFDGNIIDTTTISYNIYINAVLGGYDVTVSETFTFELYENCSKYEPVRFMFLNSLGSFDYYTATLLSRETINIQRDSYQKTLSYGYQLGDRGKTVLNVNSQETYTIFTDWISEETANWLSYEFFNSIEIYVLDNTGKLTPIVLDNNSVESKKRVNDKLINYQFNYTKAVTINTQRG